MRIPRQASGRLLIGHMRNLARNEPHITPAQIARMRTLMETYVGDVIVTGYEPLIDNITLPDLDDRHVLAAAIHSGASVIVTANLKDFSAAALAPHNIVAQHPDAFVRGLLNLPYSRGCHCWLVRYCEHVVIAREELSRVMTELDTHR